MASEAERALSLLELGWQQASPPPPSLSSSMSSSSSSSLSSSSSANGGGAFGGGSGVALSPGVHVARSPGAGRLLSPPGTPAGRLNPRRARGRPFDAASVLASAPPSGGGKGAWLKDSDGMYVVSILAFQAEVHCGKLLDLVFCSVPTAALTLLSL